MMLIKDNRSSQNFVSNSTGHFCDDRQLFERQLSMNAWLRIFTFSRSNRKFSWRKKNRRALRDCRVPCLLFVARYFFILLSLDYFFSLSTRKHIFFFKINKSWSREKLPPLCKFLPEISPDRVRSKVKSIDEEHFCYCFVGSRATNYLEHTWQISRSYENENQQKSNLKFDVIYCAVV